MISGFIPPSTAFPLAPKIHTPSLHIMGFNDIMVSPEMSIKAAAHFDVARIEIHEGGKLHSLFGLHMFQRR